MKTLRLVFAFSILAMGNTAFADHNGGCNLAEASNYAYQLADLGEQYAYGYYGQFSQAADRLHRSASMLYHAINNSTGGWKYDHNGGRFERLHEMAEQVGSYVNSFAYYARADIGSWAHSLYYSLRSNLNCY